LIFTALVSPHTSHRAGANAPIAVNFRPGALPAAASSSNITVNGTTADVKLGR
jgi:hypothetical protein